MSGSCLTARSYLVSVWFESCPATAWRFVRVASDGSYDSIAEVRYENGRTDYEEDTGSAGGRMPSVWLPEHQGIW